MANEDKVEMETITIEVPKNLMRVVRVLNYFGHTKEEFFVNAVKSRISCQLNDMHFRESEKIHKKYPWLHEATLTY